MTFDLPPGQPFTQQTATRLEDAILSALSAAGKAPTPDTLASVDEMHIGGRAATAHLMAYLQWQPGMHILDIGSGLGGAARLVAATAQAYVTGIDLSADYCRAATALTQKSGLEQYIIYKQGNATALPFQDQDFDGAYSIHAAMNIPDKIIMYRDIARVLQPGAFFGIYDVLRGENPAPLSHPLPWADDPDESILATLDEMRKALTQSGFEILVEDDLRKFGLQSLKKLRDTNPAIGPALVMGDTYPQKIANLIDALDDKRCAPWVMICRKRKWDDPK